MKRERWNIFQILLLTAELGKLGEPPKLFLFLVTGLTGIGEVGVLADNFSFGLFILSSCERLESCQPVPLFGGGKVDVLDRLGADGQCLWGTYETLWLTSECG